MDMQSYNINTALNTRKSMLFRVIAMVVSIFVFGSCEDFFLKEVDHSKIPGSEPKLVVYSFISPQDTLIKVYVYRSRPYVKPAGQVMPVNGNASVRMGREGNEFSQLRYDENLEAFTISAGDFLVEGGFDYHLKVETPLGESVTATCHVPAMGDIRLVMQPHRFKQDRYGDQILEVEWEIETPAGSKERYYRSGSYIFSCASFVQEDTRYCDKYEVWLDRGKEFFADKDGATHYFRGSYWGYVNLDGAIGEGDYGYVQQTDSVFVYLLETDRNYHHFHLSADRYFYHDDGFPFSEPVHIYSNIEGGLGVFGGYNRRNYLLAATRK